MAQADGLTIEQIADIVQRLPGRPVASPNRKARHAGAPAELPSQHLDMQPIVDAINELINHGYPREEAREFFNLYKNAVTIAAHQIIAGYESTYGRGDIIDASFGQPGYPYTISLKLPNDPSFVHEEFGEGQAHKELIGEDFPSLARKHFVKALEKKISPDADNRPYQTIWGDDNSDAEAECTPAA